MSLIDAAANGDIQACWMHAAVIHATYTTQPVHVHHSMRSIPFHQEQSTNKTRLTLPRPASNTQKQKSCARRLIAASVGMLCPNFVSLMCIHASTQEVQALLDTGMHPVDQKDGVRHTSIC